MALLISFLLFSGALLGAAYYVWAIPAQEQEAALAGRLRELRSRSGAGRRTAGSDLLIREERGTLAFLGDFVTWIGLLRRLQVFIQQADLKYRAQDVFILCLILAIATYFAVGLFGSGLIVLRLVAAFGVGSLPVLYIQRVRKKRLGKFEENLPDTIDLFNRTMKAGHNIQSGLETVATESLEPVRMEFKKVIEEIALGSTLEAALHGLGDRIPIIDLKFFITGLILQRQTGANMVAVLDNMALLIRERLNLVAKMHAATSQQRFSAGLLCVLPIVVALGFWILKPEYIRFLYTDETGSMFLTYAIVSEIVGILIIRYISSPKF